MFKSLRNLLLAAPAIFGIALSAPVIAQEADVNSNLLNQLNNYSSEGRAKTRSQVTNVNQLRDVSPADLAYEALRSLVDRYGCIAGFPNQTYRGNQALSRYEFAAGLNSCLNQIERLVASSEAVVREDIDTISRLTQEFEAELGTLSGRVDDIESRTAFLEDNAFSSTTKLEGEVVFGLAQEFNFDNQVVLQDRVRLNFVSSFTGKDALYTRLDAGNATTFNEIETGAFTFNFFDTNNNVEIGWLAYYFPIGDKIDVYLPAAFPLWQDFVPTLSPYLDTFTGASGSLSSFAESSPIYKIGLASGGGVGINFNPIEAITISGGYLGGDSFNPDADTDGGLFNDEYSVLGQIAINLFDERVQFAATYVNAQLASSDNTIFDLGVGTELARSPFVSNSLSTNSYGVAASFDLNARIALNAFGTFTDADIDNGSGESEIWSYGVGLSLPDFGKEGNLLAFFAGAEPYVGQAVGDFDGDGDEDQVSQDIPIHLEGLYKYQFNDNVSITPGIIYILSPNGDSDDDDAIIGVVRTTFTF